MGQIGSVYKQPETEVDDSFHSWRVPSKWKGLQRGSKGEPARWVSRCLAKNTLLKEEDDRYNEEMMGQTAEYTIQDSYVLKGQGGDGNKKNTFFNTLKNIQCVQCHTMHEQTSFVSAGHYFVSLSFRCGQ